MKADSAPDVDPIALFQAWLAEAERSEIRDANAMTLATVDAAGNPDARTVLLKDCDTAGFVFYSNRESAKGRQLAGHPYAALCFHWRSLGRQVRVRGPVSEVTRAEADASFDSRSRGSRIGAWASLQSTALESREVLEGSVARYTQQFGEGPVPRPERWIGWRVTPQVIEFWSEQPFRLHDRITYTRDGERWVTGRLYP